MKANRFRNKQILLRVTEREMELINKKVNVSGFSREKYLRTMAIEGRIFKQDLESIRMLAAEIKKIGVNINQIAKIANETGSVESDLTDDLKRQMEEIWRELKSTLFAGNPQI